MGSYNYAWTGNGVAATDEDQTGLSAGLYSVVATDANSCSSASLDVTITQPSAMSGSITSQTNVSVFGGNDGSITVDGSGGIAPYQYKIGAGIYQSSGSFGTLTAGSYTVTIQDNNLCTFDVLVTITQPLPPLSGSIITQSDVACFGASTGSFTVEGSGGLAPYEYSLDGAPFLPSGTFGTLPAGSYTVTVRDATLNTHDVSITINQPAEALGGLITSQADVLCFGSNTGSVTVEGSGGISPYQYKMGTGSYQASGTFGSLSAGIYTVTIQDVNLCAFDVSATILHLSGELTVSIVSQINILCSGSPDGSITVAGSGGNIPYEYSLSGGPYQTSGIFNGLDASTYTITVRDANLCTDEMSATVMEPAAITIVPTKDDVSCPGVSDGKIILSITGGSPPYVTIWSDNITTKDRLNIPEGTYTVVVKDMNGCTESLDVIITVVGSEGCLEIPTIITPNNDGYNDTWIIKNIDLFPDAEVFVFNRWGEQVFQTKNLLSNPWDGTTDGKLLPTDSYHYVLHLNDGSDPRSGVISIIK
jgi:gliding motility-associated-like protein